MTELTTEQLEAIVKNLKGVQDLYAGSTYQEVFMEWPDEFPCVESTGNLLGKITFSSNGEEWVFIPQGQREAPKWSVPIPPPFN